MANKINSFEKIVTVTQVQLLQEVETGDLMHQVTFGEFVEYTPEIAARVIPQPKGVFGSQIHVVWMMLNIKTAEFPYKIGSKWKITVTENGTIKMVEP
jgi:hypothetical protein